MSEASTGRGAARGSVGLWGLLPALLCASGVLLRPLYVLRAVTGLGAPAVRYVSGKGD